MKPESTLAKLLKGWGASAEAVAPTAVATLQAEFDAFKLTAEADTAELRSALETAVASVAEVEASRDALATKLAAFEAASAASAAAAVLAATEARKSKIVAAVGTARADALFTATEGLEDTQFTAVLSALTVTASAEAESALFVEQGASAEADAAQVEMNAPSKEMQILKAQFKVA